MTARLAARLAYSPSTKPSDRGAILSNTPRSGPTSLRTFPPKVKQTSEGACLVCLFSQLPGHYPFEARRPPGRAVFADAGSCACGTAHLGDRGEQHNSRNEDSLRFLNTMNTFCYFDKELTAVSIFGCLSTPRPDADPPTRCRSAALKPRTTYDKVSDAKETISMH